MITITKITTTKIPMTNPMSYLLPCIINIPSGHPTFYHVYRHCLFPVFHVDAEILVA